MLRGRGGRGARMGRRAKARAGRGAGGGGPGTYAASEELTELSGRETGLTAGRLRGEVLRMSSQLVRMYAGKGALNAFEITFDGRLSAGRK